MPFDKRQVQYVFFFRGRDKNKPVPTCFIRLSTPNPIEF